MLMKDSYKRENDITHVDQEAAYHADPAITSIRRLVSRLILDNGRLLLVAQYSFSFRATPRVMLVVACTRRIAS